MSLFGNPYILFSGVGIGAIGVAMALPRRGVNPQAVGGIIAGLGLGLALIALALGAGEHRPQVYFYIFAAIALGAALRVISHPRPVYAALYFILTILASAGLYLLLSAEFMAFALVIIYAGAILITYLFVIMLATQAPSEEEVNALSDYDRYAREPVVSTVTGFVLLAALISLMARGVPAVTPPTVAEVAARDAEMIQRMPGKVESALVEAGFPRDVEALEVLPTGAALVRFPSGWAEPGDRLASPPAPGETREVPLPADIGLENIEQVGFVLVGEHPLGLELAGVILLMAMLGAVVLARKQVSLVEAREHVALGESMQGASR